MLVRSGNSNSAQTQSLSLGSKGSPTCRVVSAEAKSNRDSSQSKHRIAGVVEVVGGGSHYAEVRDGVLVLHTEPCPTSQAHWKLPLRGLSLLQAKPLGLAFALASPTESSPITFQVGTEYEYEKWVKCLAVELMRQTPLDRVRFLDILGITGSLRRSRSAECVSLRELPRSCLDKSRLEHTTENFNWPSKPKHDEFLRDNKECEMNCSVEDEVDGSLSSPPPDLTSPSSPPTSQLVYRKRSQQLPDVIRDLPPCSRRSRSRKKELRVTKVRGQSLEPVSVMCQKMQPQVMELLLKCQRSDIYVPVREKRLLFESLWKREGQVARSQSLHDLSRNDNLPVDRYNLPSAQDIKTRHPLADVRVNLENTVEDEANQQRRHLHISDKLSQYTSTYGNTYIYRR